MIVMTSAWWMDATPQTCWPLVADARRWPLWWRSIREVRTLFGPGLRGQAPAAWRALLGLPLRLQAGRLSVEAGQHVEWQLRGDVDARVIWLLERTAQGGCELTCRCQYGTGFSGPGWRCMLAHLLLEHHHFRRMRACARDMGIALGCRTAPLREWSGRIKR